MTYEELLEETIRGGIAGAIKDYHDEAHRLQRAGAVAGFEACRGKTPAELALLLGDARDRADRADRDPDYWYHHCFAAEVKWCCNVVSAILLNEGRPTIIPPTVRGALRAAEIVGVRP